MKKYVLPLFMFLAALFLTVTAAASDVLGLHDGAKLLQTSERTAVMKELQDVEKRYGVGMAIITVPSTNKMKSETMPTSFWTVLSRMGKRVIWFLSWPWIQGITTLPLTRP